VILLHRESSHLPFLHRIHKKALQLLDSNCSEELEDAKTSYSQHKDNLLLVDFFSVSEYLYLLLEISSQLKSFKRASLLYLCAAVSDFYLPLDDQSQHKISSASGLNLHLHPVPKILGILKSQACPDAFIVSFKLETDEKKVIEKARESLKSYGQNLVVANCLATRNKLVTLVGDNAGDFEIVAAVDSEIEEDLICKITELYDIYRLKGQ
jgi:phosphopantothenate---cysteine ligase (ATP)